jgi:GNAT superfamily N-acetyltransferase
MHIRPATAADAAALTALMHASTAYQGPYAAILEGYAIDAAQIGRDQIHVAEGGDGLLGFYSLAIDTDEAELDLMFTADAAQGRGVGRRLFEHMRTLAGSLGASRVRIVAHPPAEGFYRRMGARVVGEQAPRGRVGWTRPVLMLDPV